MRKFRYFMETLTTNPVFSFLALLIVIIIWGCGAPQRKPVPPPQAHLVYIVNMLPNDQVVSVYSLKPTGELDELMYSKQVGVSVVKHGPMYDMNKDFAIDENADPNGTHWMKRRELHTRTPHTMKMMLKPGYYKVFVKPASSTNDYEIFVMTVLPAYPAGQGPITWELVPDEDKGVQLRTNPIFLLPESAVS